MPLHRSLPWPCLAVVLALAPACGGGGGSSTPAATAVITQANAPTLVAAAAAGAIRGDGVTATGIVGAGDASSAAALEGASRSLALEVVRRAEEIAPTDLLMTQATVGPVVVPCEVAGTITLSGTIASASGFTPGDTLTGVFDACDEGDGSVATGTLAFVVRSFSGDVISELYVLSADATMSGFVVAVGSQETTGNGTLRLTLDTRLAPVVKATFSSGQFALSIDGHTHTWTRLSAIETRDYSTALLAYTDDTSGTLTSTSFAGSIEIRTLTVMRGVGASPPASGALLVTGADGATIRVTALSATTARLEVDTDGDGVVDDARDMTWAALGL